MNEFEVLTLLLAVIGALLGVMNTWHRMSKDDLRLKVTPAHALPVGPTGAGDWTLSIEVVNLSAFPVTIDGIGLQMRDKQRLVSPTTPTTGGPLPRRLEPREALKVIFPPAFRHDACLANVMKAFATTQCGSTKYGRSPALKQMIDEAKRR